jgi:hypothetical protein
MSTPSDRSDPSDPSDKTARCIMRATPKLPTRTRFSSASPLFAGLPLRNADSGRAICYNAPGSGE